MPLAGSDDWGDKLQRIEHDAPWEGNASGCHTVLQDGDSYRMYYRGWQ